MTTTKIKIGSVRLARGYTGYDHLLDDEPLRALTGRTFASPAAVCEAAERLLADTQDARCAGAPIVILDERGTGSIWWLDGTPA